MELASQGRIPGATSSVVMAAAAWLGVYAAARIGLQYMRAGSVEAIVLAAVAPTFAFFGFIWVVQRAVRRADELQRLIQLDALAFAFSTAVCVLMGLGLLDIAHGGRLVFPPLADWWVLLPALYAVCLVVAQRRYR
jgi:hypothetical protein